MNTTDWQAPPADLATLDFGGDTLKGLWPQLHAGNHEPWPDDAVLQQAWRHYHEGHFAQAAALGLSLGDKGAVVAAFAATMQAQYVEVEPARRAALFKQAVAWCSEAEAHGAISTNLHYIHAVALGRYGQLISVMEALAQGYAGLIKGQVDKAIALDPSHAEALATLAGWHAAVSDQAGELMAQMLYGATQEQAESHYAEAAEAAPDCAVVHIERAWGIETMFGESRPDDVRASLARALALPPIDAMQVLDQRRAVEQQQRFAPAVAAS